MKTETRNCSHFRKYFDKNRKMKTFSSYLISQMDIRSGARSFFSAFQVIFFSHLLLRIEVEE